MVAVGWGRLNDSGSLPTTLQQVTVQTVDYRASTCTPTMVDWTIQFCAGVSGGGKGKFIKFSSLFSTNILLSIV